MKISHVAIYTKNLEALKNFYVGYFGGISNNKYHNIKTGLMTYFIKFEGDCSLEIMSKPSVSAEIFDEVCGISHIAFCVGGKEKVDLIVKKFVEDGYTIISQPRTTGDGYYEACVADPDGNRVEIVA